MARRGRHPEEFATAAKVLRKPSAAPVAIAKRENRVGMTLDYELRDQLDRFGEAPRAGELHCAGKLLIKRIHGRGYGIPAAATPDGGA
jgi:hypothetical protein